MTSDVIIIIFSIFFFFSLPKTREDPRHLARCSSHPHALLAVQSCVALSSPSLRVHRVHYRLGCSKRTPKKCGITSAQQREWTAKGKRIRSLYRSKLKLKHGRFRILPLDVLTDLRRQHGFTSMWPSTGLIGIVYVLRCYPDAKVYLHGYDFTRAKKSDCPEEEVRRGGGGSSDRRYVCKSSALGHFWERSKKSGTVHNMFAEGEVIRKLMKQGKVAWLRVNSPSH